MKLTKLEIDVGRTLAQRQDLLNRFQKFRNTEEFKSRLKDGYWQGFWKIYKNITTRRGQP